MKNLFKGTLLLTLLLCFGVGTGLAAGPHESENPPCYDVKGMGLSVGSGNSGVLDFDFASTYVNPALATYEACVRMSADLVTPSHVEGWAWNDNLGWVSLYCNGGSNLGVACGAVNYGVNFVTAGGPGPNGFTSVGLNGYAWNDNSGYISFNCTNNSGCGTSNYGIKLSPGAGGTQGYVDTVTAGAKYVWADSVQWMDLSGVRFPWFGVAVISNIKICTSGDISCLSCDLATGCVPNIDTLVPFADGDDKIQINLPFNDGGSLIGAATYNLSNGPCSAVSMKQTGFGGKSYFVCLELAWNDTVSLDQTLSTSQTDNCNTAAFPGGLNNLGQSCAVAKPLDFNNFISDVGDAKKYFDVKSISPTSDANIDKGTGFQNERFIDGYIDTATLDPGYNILTGDNNNVVLTALKYTVFKYSLDGIGDGRCLVGTNDGVNCNPVILNNIKFPFKPVVGFDNLVQKYGSKNLGYIQTTEGSDINLKYKYSDAGNPSVSLINAVLMARLNDSGAGEYEFKFNGGATDYSSSTVGDNVINAVIKLADGVSSGDFSNVFPHIYSVVNYTVTSGGQNYLVKFYSAKLPRLKAGLVKNPVLKAVGNVFASYNLFNKSSNTSTEIRSLGSVASNKFRENLTKKAAQAIAGNGGTYSPGGGGKKKVIGFENGEFKFEPADGVPLKLENNVYYVKGENLEFDCSGGCDWEGKWTFVVENGNVFVNTNLYPASSSAKLGLIVLNDYSSPTSKKGNVLVEKSVTDMKVNIYADRALFSYDKDLGYNPTSFEPIFSDDGERQEKLLNQLSIVGSLSSMNCIGCASVNPSYDGEGALVSTSTSSYASSGSSSEGLARARTFDLNYMRYYGPYLEVCPDGTTPKDQQGGADECNSSAAGYQIDIELKDNGGDLVQDGGGGSKSQKYAADSTEFAPLYFNYESAEGLPLFSKEIDLNPTQTL